MEAQNIIQESIADSLEDIATQLPIQFAELFRVLIANGLIANPEQFMNVQGYAREAGISLEQAMSETVTRTGDTP